MAIRLEVQGYCSECLDFTPDVTKPERSILYSDNEAICSQQTDTIVTCKYSKRCENIKKYLNRQSKENSQCKD